MLLTSCSQPDPAEVVASMEHCPTVALGPLTEARISSFYTSGVSTEIFVFQVCLENQRCFAVARFTHGFTAYVSQPDPTTFVVRIPGRNVKALVKSYRNGPVELRFKVVPTQTVGRKNGEIEVSCPFNMSVGQELRN